MSLVELDPDTDNLVGCLLGCTAINQIMKYDTKWEITYKVLHSEYILRWKMLMISSSMDPTLELNTCSS